MPKFSLKTPRLLAVQLSDEQVLAKSGAMVAFVGAVRFEKALLGGEGVLGALKRRAANEGSGLMLAAGQGMVFFAHEAHDVTIVQLSKGRLSVEGGALLAYDQALSTTTVFAGLRGATAGQGLFTTVIEGTGAVAVLSDGPAIALAVDPSQPLFVDPDAFVAFQGELEQTFVYDVSWKSALRGSSGESYQLRFAGTGTVYVQPAERVGTPAGV